MKVEYINPFIESSVSVITQTTGLNPTLGKVHVKQQPYKGDNVVVLIGLTGEIQGNVVITLGKELACNIASAMMCGMPVPELDEMAKSAISELCNMILGSTANMFYNNNTKIDITPPTLLTGENMEFTSSNALTICIPLHFDAGQNINIDISYKENV